MAIQASLELGDLVGGDVVEEAVGGGPDDDDLLLDRQRLVLRLLEDLGRLLARVSWSRVALSRSAELGERRQLAVLGEVDPQLPGDLRIALICAAPPARETLMPAFTAGAGPG
jgi:hypothetical protein